MLEQLVRSLPILTSIGRKLLNRNVEIKRYNLNVINARLAVILAEFSNLKMQLKDAINELDQAVVITNRIQNQMEDIDGNNNGEKEQLK